MTFLFCFCLFDLLTFNDAPEPLNLYTFRLHNTDVYHRWKDEFNGHMFWFDLC